MGDTSLQEACALRPSRGPSEVLWELPPAPTGACSLSLPRCGVSGTQKQFQVQSDGAVRRVPGAFKGTLLQRTSERLTKKVVGSASHLCRLDGGVQTQLVRQLSCPPTSGYFPLPSLGPFTSRVPEGWWLLYYFCRGARWPAQPAVTLASLSPWRGPHFLPHLVHPWRG